MSLQYCNAFCLFYVRELTLINFNFPNIAGNEGIYHKFPAKENEKESYRLLIKKKLEEIFLENQSYIKNIFSSSFSLSKKAEKSLLETFLSAGYSFNKITGSIESDVLSTLIQYNSALYNIASCYTPVYQSHPDLYNYMYNGYNDYSKAIILLNDKYINELNSQRKTIIIILILGSILIFIVFIFFCIFMALSYISSTKRRIIYMRVFYELNSNSIKNLVINF